MRESNRTLEPLLFHLTDYGDRPAIVQVSGSGSETWTYPTLHDEVARYASGIQQSGIERGDTVALFSGTGGIEWITACLSLIRAGAVPVPLDSQLDERSLRHILHDCGARWALTDREHVEKLTSAGFEGRSRLFDAPEDDEHAWRAVRADAPGEAAAPSPDDMAVLFYTSGTTGPPKGVPLAHRHLDFQLRALGEAELVGPEDRLLQPLPLHHVYPLVVGTLAPLALGVTIVLPEAMMGPQLLEAIRRQDVTFIIGVPRLYRALLSGIESRLASERGIGGAVMRAAARSSYLLRRRFGIRAGKALLYPLHQRLGPRLRVLASGGSALDPEVAWRLEGFGWYVAVGYGLTETSPLLTLNPPGSRRLDSAGRPVPGIEIRIDQAAQPGDEDEAGRDGEILARGESVFGGYLGHENESDDTFTEDGWYRTGDLGRIDDQGYLFVTGRKNTMIVTSAGKNVQPEEIEDHYAKHPFIEEIGVCAAEDGLAAVIVPAAEEIRRQQISTQHAIRRALSESAHDLPSYRRVVRYVVSTQPLARTRLGKIQRHRLKERYKQLLESPDDPKAATAKSTPIDIAQMEEADRRLLEHDGARAVWDVLARRYADRRLTPDTNVQLDLNVDSLGWLELSTEIAQETGVSLDEESIVSIDTVRDLLRTVSESAPSEGGAVRAPLDDPDAALGDDQKRWLEPLSAPALRMSRGLLGLNRLMMKRVFDLQVRGTEHLDPNLQVLIAPNHTSFLDSPAIAAALPNAILEKTYWGGWTGYAFRNAAFRAGSRLARVVPVDPDRAASSSLAFAAGILKRGNNLVWFPEGERSLTGELIEFRPGLGLLLEHYSEMSVLPVHIAGAYEAWPRDRPRPRRHPITVTFGAPVAVKDLAAGGDGDMRARILAGLHDALEAVSRQR